MDTPSWISRLAAATTGEEVVWLAREYVESRAGSELAALPKECQPISLHTADDVASYAYTLVAYHGHDDNSRVIHRLADFFSRAAVRLGELRRS